MAIELPRHGMGSELELYNTMMCDALEEQFLTTVVICGPPVEKRFNTWDRDGNWSNWGERRVWIDAVGALCVDRFGLKYPMIGDFITVMNVWWSLKKENRT